MSKGHGVERVDMWAVHSTWCEWRVHCTSWPYSMPGVQGRYIVQVGHTVYLMCWEGTLYNLAIQYTWSTGILYNVRNSYTYWILLALQTLLKYLLAMYITQSCSSLTKTQLCLIYSSIFLSFHAYSMSLSLFSYSGNPRKSAHELTGGGRNKICTP